MLSVRSGTLAGEAIGLHVSVVSSGAHNSSPDRPLISAKRHRGAQQQQTGAFQNRHFKETRDPVRSHICLLSSQILADDPLYSREERVK